MGEQRGPLEVSHSPSAPSPDSTELEVEPQMPLSPPSSRLRLCRDRSGETGGGWMAHAFPLRTVAGQYQYWPFSASDLYNWKTHNPSFSQDPQALTGLIESILLTHQPTWDDCQQLLQALLTTEERQRVFLEARKNVPGEDGRPTQLPNEIDEVFPLTRPNWDFNIAADVQEMEEVIKTCQEGPDECLCEVAVTKSNPVEERVRLITCLSQHYYHS
ncbi:uncharacterized protein [Dipodomys merriami]|uniref:uncharacterized protein isoform X1 n=2 Tax=Dipodomys merriami TaxID=94247 RepID=UPI0038557A50